MIFVLSWLMLLEENIEIMADTNLLCLAIANHDVVGVDHNCVNFSVEKTGVEDKNTHVIPVNQCLNSIQLTVEEHLLIHLGQACNVANAPPLYLFDEIVDIIQVNVIKVYASTDKIFTRESHS